MRKLVYVHGLQNVLPVMQKLLENDVPEIHITDDRGGSGCWIVIAQADFLPALTGLPFQPDFEWENVPKYGGSTNVANCYRYGDMPEDDND